MENAVAVTSYPAVVGAMLMVVRKSIGLSQSDLANTIGINVSSWSRIESGETALTVEQLALAAERFGVDPSFILKAAEDKIVELGQRGIAISRTRSNVDAIVAAGAIPLVGVSLLGAIGPLGALAAGAAAGYKLYSKLIAPKK